MSCLGGLLYGLESDDECDGSAFISLAPIMLTKLLLLVVLLVVLRLLLTSAGRFDGFEFISLRPLLRLFSLLLRRSGSGLSSFGRFLAWPGLLLLPPVCLTLLLAPAAMRDSACLSFFVLLSTRSAAPLPGCVEL